MDELLFLTRCIVTWFCVCSCGSVVGLHKLRWVGINIFRGHSFYFFSPFLILFVLLCLLNLFKIQFTFFKHTFGHFVLGPREMLSCQVSGTDRSLRSPQLACLAVPLLISYKTMQKNKKNKTKGSTPFSLRFQSASLERTRSCYISGQDRVGPVVSLVGLS